MAKSKKATQAANDVNEAGTYRSLRQSLDSFRDVALAQYALSQTSEERIELSGFVLKTVKDFLQKIALKHRADWKKSNPASAKKIRAQAETMATSPSQCPPGFVDNGQGQCVPIGMPL